MEQSEAEFYFQLFVILTKFTVPPPNLNQRIQFLILHTTMLGMVLLTNLEKPGMKIKQKSLHSHFIQHGLHQKHKTEGRCHSL